MSDAQPITGLRPGQVGSHVFLCGDPARVARIASSWKGVEEVCSVREYRVMVGELDGIRLTAASTGIGAPSTAILIEELTKLGSHTYIRIGNSGGLDPRLELGELVISTGAVRDDGTSRSYVVPEYPAVADYRVVGALVAAARGQQVPFHAGITWSLDAFYARNAIAMENGAMASMSVGGYWTAALEERIRSLRAARVLNCEMEAGVLLTLAGLFGLRAGAVCVVSDRTPWEGPAAIDLDRNMHRCIDVATAAMLQLAREQRGD
ncbi:uridine phosphorylase [Myxococcaceae bacterium]|nr:uridine phosphorylase [Myxococcaceae bacterium]